MKSVIRIKSVSKYMSLIYHVILKVKISKGVLLFIFTFLFTQYHKVASKSVMSKATRSIVAINRMQIVDLNDLKQPMFYTGGECHTDIYFVLTHFEI